MSVFFYDVEQCGDFIRFESDWDEDRVDFIAEDAAAHFYDVEDGWEWDWPLLFEIFDEDKKLLGKRVITIEWSPEFVGSEHKEGGM